MTRVIFMTLICSAVIGFMSCQKELSFEGNNNPVIIDTTNIDTSVRMGTDSSYIDPSIAALNTWHFTDSVTGVYYEGNFNRAAGKIFGDSILNIWGTTNSSTDTGFNVYMYFDRGVILPGIYACINFIHPTSISVGASNDAIYGSCLEPNVLVRTPSYITIISYNPLTKNVIGSFHSWCFSYGNNITTTLLRGSFNCIIP